ncbi:uncharacterized protein LOC125502436 [Dendroctonus ponderosae]|uniref:uncharacterized protein LOC125502436 n=1 Tax=Dendroctonus ponderosae TaxID=77166 RepID=UPI0020351A9A|nr:uncharacterized protein LOC125502436 [Dendroctonus ponderosae]
MKKKKKDPIWGRPRVEKIEENPILNANDINLAWERIKNNIKNSAREALGERTRKVNQAINHKTPGFRPEVQEQCKEKRKAYLKYSTMLTPESYNEYKQVRSKTKKLRRKITNGHWEMSFKRLEGDFYGLQKQIWRFIRSHRKEVNELYKTTNTAEININEDATIDKSDVENALQKLRNRKSAEQDGIQNELLKYGGQRLTEELTTVIEKIIYQHKIPDEWRTSTTVLMFQQRGMRANYRGINLLSTALKLTPKVITNKINNLKSLADEQQGFISGRSCTDVFVLRQIVEKSIEYNKPAFICFVDLTRAFDRVQLKDVLQNLTRYQ